MNTLPRVLLLSLYWMIANPVPAAEQFSVGFRQYPFHVEYLHRSLSEKAHRYSVYQRAHHFAFISPYPEWLLAQEHIPVALDPDGFDRREFLTQINAELVDFFRESMPPQNRGKPESLQRAD